MLQMLGIFYFGALFGSFLDCQLVQAEENRFDCRSCCDRCHRPLSFYELLPLFSYLALKGRCRTCQQKIDPRSFLAEILSGLLSVFIFHLLKADVFMFFLIEVLLAIAVCDFRNGWIADRFQVLLFIGILLISRFHRVPLSYSCALFITIPLIPFAFFDKLGWGDIKLIALCALLLKDSTWQALLIASLLAMLRQGVLLFLHQKTRSSFPFAPYLVIGFLTVMMASFRHLP